MINFEDRRKDDFARLVVGTEIRHNMIAEIGTSSSKELDMNKRKEAARI